MMYLPRSVQGMMYLHRSVQGMMYLLRSIQGMMYLPWSNSWSWTSDCSVNYALHAVKIETKD